MINKNNCYLVTIKVPFHCYPWIERAFDSLDKAKQYCLDYIAKRPKEEFKANYELKDSQGWIGHMNTWSISYRSQIIE